MGGSDYQDPLVLILSKGGWVSACVDRFGTNGMGASVRPRTGSGHCAGIGWIITTGAGACVAATLADAAVNGGSEAR